MVGTAAVFDEIAELEIDTGGLVVAGDPEVGPQSEAPVYPPRLELVWWANGGGWYLTWDDSRWVLQEAANLDGTWVDVLPPASSPHPVGVEGEGGQKFFRLRGADQE